MALTKLNTNSLADNAVTTAKIHNTAVTTDKLHNQITHNPLTLSDTITLDNPGSETRITGKDSTPISLNYNNSGAQQKAADVAFDTDKGPYLLTPELSGYRQTSRYWHWNSDSNNTYGSPGGTYQWPINESPWFIIGNFQFRSRRYLHVKINRTSNVSGPMEQAWAQGYLYSQGVFDAHVGWYAYTGGPINIHTRNNCTSGGITVYQSSDNKIVVRMDRGATGYTEGEVSLCWRQNSSRVSSRYRTDNFPTMIESRLTDSSSLY